VINKNGLNEMEACMYIADERRYDKMKYNRCGASGLMLPAVSLGLWHNFGSNANFDNMLNMCHTAFDQGITHFDLANNYGPVPGAAEKNFGRILNDGMMRYRDELVISTKAGYDMWPGPYGNWGSRKYLIASLDQSLKRLGLDYVDIFYHHRPDPDTPLEETAGALNDIVKSGKALYIGISNYNKEQTEEIAGLFKKMGTPFIINQRKYSMLDRTIEKDGLKSYAAANGIGVITFSPLAQGLLSDRYLQGIPKDSRIATDGRFLTEKNLDRETMDKIERLNKVAKDRGQSLAQMALSWIMRDGDITSVLVGASKPAQILDNLKMMDNMNFSDDEIAEIEKILE
jgi:L-glyceraldehyde 3-phosphate reductase